MKTYLFKVKLPDVHLTEGNKELFKKEALRYLNKIDLGLREEKTTIRKIRDGVFELRYLGDRYLFKRNKEGLYDVYYVCSFFRISEKVPKSIRILVPFKKLAIFLYVMSAIILLMWITGPYMDEEERKQFTQFGLVIGPVVSAIAIIEVRLGWWVLYRKFHRDHPVIKSFVEGAFSEGFMSETPETGNEKVENREKEGVYIAKNCDVKGIVLFFFIPCLVPLFMAGISTYNLILTILTHESDTYNLFYWAMLAILFSLGSILFVLKLSFVKISVKNGLLVLTWPYMKLQNGLLSVSAEIDKVQPKFSGGLLRIGRIMWLPSGWIYVFKPESLRKKVKDKNKNS